MSLSQKLLHTYAFFCVDPRALHKYIIISKNHFDNNYIELMYTHCQNSYAVQDGYLFSNLSKNWLLPSVDIYFITMLMATMMMFLF